MEITSPTLSGPPGQMPGEAEMDRIAAASRGTVEEIANMIGKLEDTGIPIPRSEWTVGETGAHLAFAAIGFSMFARGLYYPYGDGTPQGLADANEMSLLGFSERGGPELAAHLRQGTRNFLAELAVRPPDQECHSPVGVMSLGTLASYFLAHNLMHGVALSAALKEDFVFRAEHMPLIWPFVCYAFQGPLVEPEANVQLSACIEIGVRDAFDFAITFRDGKATFSSSATDTADCRIDADALHLFLVLIKVLTVQEAIDLGKFSVSGPNPELALRFMDFFYVP